MMLFIDRDSDGEIGVWEWLLPVSLAGLVTAAGYWLCALVQIGRAR